MFEWINNFLFGFFWFPTQFVGPYIYSHFPEFYKHPYKTEIHLFYFYFLTVLHGFFYLKIFQLIGHKENNYKKCAIFLLGLYPLLHLLAGFITYWLAWAQAHFLIFIVFLGYALGIYFLLNKLELKEKHVQTS